MITAEQMHEMELQTPKYEFVEPEPDAPKVSPIKQQIAKIQETASTFSLYDVYRSMGMLDRQIADRDALNEKDRNMKALFEAEIAFIETSLGVKDLETQYQNELAAEAATAQLLSTTNEQDSKTN